MLQLQLLGLVPVQALLLLGFFSLDEPEPDLVHFLAQDNKVVKLARELRDGEHLKWG